MTPSVRPARTRCAALLLLALLAVGARPAAAQVTAFGKNKIQYDDFQWEILASEHVDLYYYPEERELALIALDYAEASYAALEQKFSYHPQDRIPLVVYASHQHFEQTNIVPFFIPEGVAGFTEFLKGRVALPFNGSYADFRRVIRHELVHVFQARKGAHLKRLHPSGYEWASPQWFTEGLAEYWSGPWGAEGDLVVRDLLLNGRVPDIIELDRYAGTFAVYKLGQHLQGWLAVTYGEDRLVELMESEWKHKNFSTAFRKVFGVTLADASERWHRDLRAQYFPTLAAERPVATTATPVVTEGRLNFTPAIVPGGGEQGAAGLAYVSLHSGYATIRTADLYGENEDLDAEVTGDRSGDYESFHPLQSAIDVSPQGRLAFVAKSGARDVLYVHELASGDREYEGEWADLVALASPTWAPDGRRLVFVGLSRSGFADLYLWDTATGRRERLTDDRYLEIAPSWSPVRDEIAFASDRTPFGREGSRNLYRLDIASREITPLTFGRWVDRDPDWAPDGERMVFASDRAGTLDLYFVDRSGDGRRATEFAAGVMHPRWFRDGATATTSEGIVFTAYENMAYDIYRVPLPPEAPATFALAADASVPGWHWDEAVPDPARFAQRPYKQEFGLDFAAAALAFSEDGGRGEGAQLVFSDQLGDHLLVAQINSQSGRSNLFSGFTGVASYVNIKHRVNWGVSGYRLRSVYTSLLGGDFGRGALDQEGIGIRNDFFEARWGGSGLVAYPLSKFHRVEGQLTVERNEITELPNGPEDFDDLFLRDAWLTIGSFSYIYDNALWTPAGPIDGQRMNLTLSAVGNATDRGLESTEVLLDARKYFRTSLHTTYAVRARGRIATGDVPTFYYLGGPASLRGYPRYLLNGNYTALLNQEWRFPLIRPGGQREGWATLLGNGVWGALFVDLGNAWTDATTLRADDGTTRRVGGYPGLLGSYGASLRYPLAGPFILRFDWARRFDIEETRGLFPGEKDKTHFSFFLGYNY